MNVVATALAAAVVTSASADFLTFYTVKTQNFSTNRDVYQLYARFSGPTDAVVLAFNLNRAFGFGSTNIFYHQDQFTECTLTKEFGTWDPSKTCGISGNTNDSYLTIGGLPTGTNTTTAEPTWPSGQSWNRPDLPLEASVGWYNSNPLNFQGRVGQAGNPSDAVRLGQFVVDRDVFGGIWNLTIGYNRVHPGPALFSTGTFVLPAPGAFALLGMAGLAGRRRR